MEKLSKYYNITAFEAKHDFEFSYLVQPNICLVDCEYEIKVKTIYFYYEIKNEKTILHLPEKYKCLYLFNLIYFLPCYQEYKLSFDEDNLYYDINFVPKFLKRDVSYHKIHYLDDIKITSLWLLDSKHDLSYYRINGLFIEYSNRLLNEIKDCMTLQHLQQLLYEAIHIEK